MMCIVKAADRLFSLRQATSFGLNIIKICVLLYVISYYPKYARDQSIFSTYFVWLVICSSDVIIACVSDILITSGVKYIKSTIKPITETKLSIMKAIP